MQAREKFMNELVDQDLLPPLCIALHTFAHFGMAKLPFVFLIFLFLTLEKSLSKECTNVPTQQSSHTFRYALLSSPNPSAFLNSTGKQIQETLASHLAQVTGINYSVSQDIPNAVRKALESDDSILQEVSLHDVSLSPNSLQGKAQQTNLEYLLMLDVDNLVWSFRNTANLSTPGSPYGGWESPKSELRGHFVGHYMSATAQMWASTHNSTLHEKMTAVVDALSECQQTMGTGYLSAFPSEFFDRFENIQPVWAPYYTIHKIMAGLLDQYTFARNTKAFTMAVDMANYFNERVMRVIEKFTIERHWESLNEETGGMNDVLYRLFTLTDNIDHLQLAHLFDKPCFLGLLAVQADSISGFHSNTHIPVVVGAQMRYEVTGDNLYKDISNYFMDIVNSSHSYPTGGTSYGEFWTDPLHLGDTLSSTETEESCTTYNMLKVSRHLFRWTKDMKYVDYYERALTNGVLSIQRGQEPGIMIYMLPMGKGDSKAISYHGWGTKFDSFWCCYGTGIESFSKLGDSIYFEDSGTNPVLYIIQLVSSSLTWSAIGCVLHQTVDDLSSTNPYLNASFELYSINENDRKSDNKGGTSATIYIRIPFWVESSGGSVSLNNETLQIPLPGEFLNVTREWQSGDKLELSFPVLLRAEQVKDGREEYASLHALFFGPYLLAGISSGDWDITGVDLKSIAAWVTPIPDSFSSEIYSFSQETSSQNTLNFMTHADNSLLMTSPPLEGTNEAAFSTFRLADPVAENLASEACLKTLRTRMTMLIRQPKSLRDGNVAMNLVGKLVAIQPFNHPGRFLAHIGDRSIGIFGDEELQDGAESCACEYEKPSGMDAVFQVIPGLSAQEETVSFEAASKPGCFLSTQTRSGQPIQLECKKSDNDPNFNKAGSFLATKGITSYHPMSFVAKGINTQFLLFPLLSYKDENYTIFFNITSNKVS